jgi:hypothetical protein
MKKNPWIKIKAGCALLVLVLAFFITNVQPARAIPTEVIASVPDTTKTILDKIKDFAAKSWKTFGAKLVGTTIRNTLNRVALNAATYVATAGEGQRPTYVVEDFGTYWKNIGDAAAGDFIDGLGKGWGVDLCTPPDANIQAKISLGLVQTMAPDAPNCTLTNLVSNYSSAYEKYAAMESGDYLKGIQVSFDAGGSELGGAFTLFGRTFATSTKAAETEKDKNTITQGWLDVRNIAGKLKGTPGAAKDDLATAKKTQADSLLSTTGDALVDAANTFLNQLAYEGFQRVMREISKGKSTSDALDTTKLASSGFESLIQYGESVVSEKLASVIKPRFDVRSDYSILSDLATCQDNANPGPTTCVIDDKFSQAISEKLTVGEALTKGYLHGDWLVSGDSKSDSTYTLRSANILRKYRIVPIGWEQAISTAVSKGYKVTLQDLISCFDGKGMFSANFDKNNQSWCRDLVDPNWVLKAPLNSCAKQGAGNQILSSLISQDANGLATLAISRAADYCADDQTCISEKADGSCEVYGYCNEEKRTWKFNSDSCEPIYNTCQTFTSVSEKQTASFLENTLDYSTCDSNNSGCKQYSYNGSYSSSTNTINWDNNYSIFFNSKASSCSASSEACTKLLRGKPGWADVNYIMDSAFSLNNIGETSESSTNWHWPVRNAIASIVNDGTKVLSIDGSNEASLYSDNDHNILPKNLAAISGWSYTLSADIKINSGDRVDVTLGNNGDKAESSSNAWTTISVTANNISNLNLAITGYGPDGVSFSIRNLKLTPNNFYTAYSNYATFPVYEKLLPKYLENSCYNSTSGTGDYTLKDGAPAVCDNFARKCNREEVGCELFTSVKDIFAVAAKANVADYCDASCVGYDTYLAKSSYFYGTAADNLIPEKTTACSAQSVGCASFTNLDAATAGGESVEYYSKVRQCIKPDTASCSDFYSWDNAQLKVMSLQKDNSGNPAVVNAATDNLCTKEIYSLPVTDPKYNPDCREFYNKSGSITYHLISNTVSCSNDCYAYRLNGKNTDRTLNESACNDNSTNKHWDSAQSVCYVCQNGGVWDNKQASCIYQVVPSEGTTCSAPEVGCREYNGNNGNNLKLVATYDFETGINGFYSLTNSGTVSQSSESTVKNGHSLSVINNIGVDVSSFATKGSAYVVKFMAKSVVGATANIYFENSNKEVSTFGVDANNTQGDLLIKGDNQWHIYEINIDQINHETAGEVLKIKVNNYLALDNLIIHEVTDRYYLIQGSSQVPDVCYYDMSDVYQGPSYNLGCSAYKDRAGTVNNLHQFSELCQNSAVGCEQMIQTNDSETHYGYNVNLNNSDKKVTCVAGTPGCIEVKDAEAIYAVFDEGKQCNKADAGCTRFGYLKTTNGLTTWVDSYKKNLPDTYNNANSPLCQSSEVGCDTWVYGNGSASYFKTPGLNTCVFKSNNWYKSPVKRCDSSGDGKISGSETTGSICLADLDCGTKKCITDTNDYICSTTYLKTIGLGGADGRVATPDTAVGLCNVESATCGEYIDPVSKYVNNLIYNPTAQEIDGSTADKWTVAGSGYYTQRISVKPNRLYILQVDGTVSNPVILDTFSSTLNGNGGLVRILGTDNKLGDLVSSVTSNNSIMFVTGVNNYLTVRRYGITTDANNPAASVSVKEAVVNYQLKNNIDTTTCNGVVNTDAGCVLFNARAQAGRSGLNANIFNATATGNGSAPTACTDTTNCSNNANTVIKVSPDRTCSRWLACQTYTEDPVTHERTCYKMGECDQLNEKNECGNFLDLAGVNRDIKNSQNKNATGYSLINDWYIGGMKEVGQNTDAHFDFENNAVSLTCRRDINIPGSGALFDVKDKACSFDNNINDSLIISPKNAPTDYPAHGKGFLKVLNYYQISPLANNSSISVYANQDYYINYLVNTKGSSAKAKLLITDNSGNVKASFIDEASSGWERKVYKFNISDASNTKKPLNIKIYLTSNATNLTTGYVYFDDINIEPVLQTGNNSYVAKDCRLYPGEDSLSCLSTDNNVVKDGLYGYCLQYDKANPKVCLLWYPVDQISTTARNSQSVLGYSGKFPLYYCSQANGNFDLMEKRIGVLHSYSGGAADIGTIVNRAFRTSSYNYDGTDHLSGDAVDCSSIGVTKNGSGDCRCFRDSSEMNKDLCGNDDYSALTFVQGGDNPRFIVYCAPKKSALSVISNTKTVNFADMNGGWDCQYSFNEGWGKYTGFFREEKSYNQGNGPAPMDENNLHPIDEATNANGTGFDPIMVLNNAGGNKTENDLKYISNADTDKVYRFSCDRFAKLVDDDGSNIAWSNRIGRSSIFTTSTPDFFGGEGSLNSDSSLYSFGRNREDVPFGASVLPSDYNFSNSEPILLRNQYSKKNNETIFAGRPYGCSGGSCGSIGQCSLDPNVYCIYTADSELNKKGCSSGGFGTCTMLWRQSSKSNYLLPSFSTAISNLNQIFMKKYGDLEYSISGYKSLSYDNSIATFYNPSGSNGFVDNHLFTSPINIKPVLPVIKNNDFRLVGSATPLSITGNYVNIEEAGLYQLSFNTIINAEQQPMKQIAIDWGDGIQVITNMDNKPEDGTPHKFYHFYLKGLNRLEVRITDNWDAYRCAAMSGTSWDISGTACQNLK